MAHSIEGRLPFLDHKVVELVRNMSVALKIRGLTEKYVLREAAKPLITETIYHRQKHPSYRWCVIWYVCVSPDNLNRIYIGCNIKSG